MNRRHIKIRSGTVGKNTEVEIDGVKVEGLVSAEVRWTVGDINHVILTYLVDDLDVETDADDRT